MKSTLKLGLYIVIVLAVASCSKTKVVDDIVDGGGGSGNQDLGFYVKATIDGVDYLNDNDEDTAFTVATETDGTKFVAFAGVFSDTHRILLGIKDFTGTGTYNIPDGKGSSMLFQLADTNTGTSEIWLANDDFGSGVYNITQYGNGTARGTFSGTVINIIDQTEVEITNGEFYLLLIE